MEKLNQWNQKGFTLIELLMVILVIAILAVIGITQFVNYGKDSRDAATKSNLQILRRAISEMNGMMRLRCNIQTTEFPPVGTLNANNITALAAGTYTQGTVSGTVAPCNTTTQVPNVVDQLFVSAGIPVNPWSSDIQTSEANSKLVTECAGAGCAVMGSRCNQACDGNAYAGTENGWCYNPTTGEIWANTARNDGDNPAVADADDECSY